MKRIQLEYFVQVVEQNSFTKAAEKLFISQPALSKSIQSIERELDILLFKRDHRGLKLTEAGQIFYDYAVDILTYNKTRTEALCTSLRQQKNILRFGLPPSAGSLYFSKIIHQFSMKFPNIELRIIEETSKKIEELLIEEELDLGVVVEPYEHPAMVSKLVLDSEAVLAVSREHPFAQRSSITFRELEKEPLLMVSQDYMFYDRVCEKCREAGFAPNVAFCSSHWDVLLEMAASNEGVTIIGKPLVEKMYGQRLACIHLEKPEFSWGLSLVRRKDAVMSPAMKYFWELCTLEENLL